MMLMCPTSSAGQTFSSGTRNSTSSGPPRCCSASRSLLSANSWATLVRRIGFPVGEQRMRLGCIVCLQQSVAEVAVGEHLSQFGEQAQVELCGRFGNQK